MSQVWINTSDRDVAVLRDVLGLPLISAGADAEPVDVDDIDDADGSRLVTPGDHAEHGKLLRSISFHTDADVS